MIKVAHYADLHASMATKDEALKMLSFILQAAVDCDVDLIINAGDTFDGPIILGDKSPLNEIVDLMYDCPIRQLIIEGTKSHDIPGSIDILSKIAGVINIYRKPSNFCLKLLVGKDFDTKKDCHISVLPAPTKLELLGGFTGDPRESSIQIKDNLRGILRSFGLAARGSSGPHIVVTHISVSGAKTPTGQMMLGSDIEVSLEDLELAAPTYVALGHIHTSIQPNLPKHIRYAGSPYPLNFGELEEKNFTIVTFDDAGHLTDIEIIPTPCRKRQLIEAKIYEGNIVLSETPYPGADIKVSIIAQTNELSPEMAAEVEAICAKSGAASVKVESIVIPTMRLRPVNLVAVQALRAEVAEYAAVKALAYEATALDKADVLEEEEAAV